MVSDISENKASQSFVSGIIVLTVANILTKVIGLVFKIPLTNMLGDAGMGYFNTAYQIYTWLYMISTAGLPVALSLMVSEYSAKNDTGKIKQIFRTTLLVFGILGLIGSVTLISFCRQIASFISADLSYLCILSIAPALFFICISSTVRGYFQGYRNMIPTAFSEVIEAAGKLIIGISLGYYALNKGYPIHTVAAYAIFGITIGIAAGTLFLTVFSLIKKPASPIVQPSTNTSESKAKLFVTFLKIALPVMLSSSLLSMSSMIDTMIVIRRLKGTGLSEQAAVSLYGNYTAYCVTLFNLPPVLIYPIANTLIPSISAARARGDKGYMKFLMFKSLKLASVIALPCALGLAVLSGPILKLIFSDAASAEMAAPLLASLAPSVFLIGVMAVTNSILQSFRMQKLSVFSMAMGAIVKAVSAYFLVGIRIGDGYLHMYASPISTFLFYLTITLLNLYFISRYIKISLPMTQIFLRPFAAAFVCAISASGAYIITMKLLDSNSISTLFSIALSAVVYLVSLWLFGGITADDLKLIPKAEALFQKNKKLANKLGLSKK